MFKWVSVQTLKEVMVRKQYSSSVVTGLKFVWVALRLYVLAYGRGPVIVYHVSDVGGGEKVERTCEISLYL